MSETMVKTLIFFGIASSMGWVLLIAGIHTGRKKKNRQLWEDARTTGTIADYVSHTFSSGRGGKRVFWWPVVEFAAGEKKYRLEYGGPVDRAKFPVGMTVTVLYEVDHPEHFHLEEDVNFYKGSASVARTGLIWILASAVLAVVLAVFVGGARLDSGKTGRRANTTGTSTVFYGKGVFQYRTETEYTAVIVGYTGDDETLTIPWAVEGHLISGFTSGAFARAMKARKITVPGRFLSVPAGAFSGCVALRELTIEEGVKNLGRMTVGICPNLQLVTLPASLLSIPDDAFPDGCAAVFRVVEGSEAEAYCRKKGYTIQPAE